MDQILQTKLVAPVLRERLVARLHLVHRLEDGLLRAGEFQRKLTLVAAPAGYGKTTLVAGWLRAAGRPSAWLSLEEADNDPARFLAYLVAALNSLGVGNAARQALQSPQPPPAQAVVSILLNELSAGSQALTLVLDDYHAIHTPQIHQMVAFLLDHLPTHAHLVVVTREDPLLPVPRLRARGQSLEVRQDALRFAPPESDQFLRGVMALDLSDEEVRLLEQRTEGWIAGLQLAALAMQGLSSQRGAGFGEFIRAFAGSSRYMMEYLIAEVFQLQPAGVQEFLLKTAVLERMCGSLCDRVAGLTGGQALLEQLEQANLFIVPLDQAGEWYRYHHLFGEFLRHRLRVQQGGEPAALHQRASRWFEEHGFLGDAIRHALAAEDWQRAGSLIERAKDAMLRRGEVSTLLGWYRRLPDELVRASPALALGYAWPLLLTSQLDQADALLSAVEPGVAEGSPDQGNLFAARAFLARSRGDHNAVIAASEKALALLAPSNPAVVGTLAVNLGIAYWHSGRLDETEKTMGEVEQVAAATGNLYAALTARFFTARSLASRGLLKQAEPRFRQLALESERTPLAALPLFDLATLLIEWHQLEEAEHFLRQGIDTSAQTGNEEFLSSGYLILGRLHLARKQHPAALAAADQAFDLVRTYPAGARARCAAFYALVHLARGDVEQAARWNEQMPARVDAHPLYRFLDLTQARVQIAQRRYAEANRLLAESCQLARRSGWGYGLVAALALRALAAQTVEEAAGYLAEAFDLAEAQGYLLTFLEAGEGLIPALREAARRGDHPEYAGRILAALGGAGEPRRPQGLAEALSERELEVLRLVAAGLSNREIARQLVVSTGTAKTHVHNLCGKLGARNRTEAAARARELGLL